MVWSSKSRQERGYGAEWDRKRKKIWRRDAGQCIPCAKKGRVTPADHVDHIIPRARGGSEDDDNLQCICLDCHKTKTAYEGLNWKPAPAVGEDGWPEDG